MDVRQSGLRWQTDQWPTGSLLAALGPTDRAELLGLGTRRTFRQNETITHQDDDGDAVYVLLSGLVRVADHTYDGRTALLAIRVAGDLVDELSEPDARRRSTTVSACVDTTVRVIDQGVFDKYLAAHPAAAAALQRTAAAKQQQATRSRVDLGGAPALTRLARLLDQLAARHGRAHPRGRLVDVPLSESDLAAVVGVSLAAAQRALAELHRRGLIIHAYRRTVVTDQQRLHFLGLGRLMTG